MEPQTKPKTSAKDFFLNLGAVVALYTVVISLINLLFTIIDTAYPPINNYYYYGSHSISWPVAILVIFFPILILIMWILEKEFIVEPERKNVLVRKWLSYITLFVAGVTLAGDLVTILYYFIDGQALTAGFLLKVLVVLVVSGCVFLYYISDVRDKLNHNSRKMWRVISTLIIVGSIVWGFSVLGSPRTQRLIKYDEQKVNDLQNISNSIQSYFSAKQVLPANIEELTSSLNYFYGNKIDSQTQKPYEYKKTGNNSYELCAEFNKELKEKNDQGGYVDYSYPKNFGGWTHPAGRHCFGQTVVPAMVPQYPPIKIPAL